MAEGFYTLHLDPEGNPDHRASWPIAFRGISIPCRTDTYLLRPDCFIRAMPLASTLAETDPSLRNFVGPERVWLDLWTHMGGFM